MGSFRSTKTNTMKRLRMVCGIVVRTDEENGADEVDLYGKIYAVERKYRRVDGYTEIYLREKP